mgnify:CR=1 FL=1|tara:strand:+ start:55 stop:1035 length:981 start_codon:yes stop_codon:yes gene_type:complete
MSVPNTNTFTLQNVVDAVNPTSNDLADCFADAISSNFDSTYSGSKNSLLNFRNYGAVPWVISDITENSNSPATLSSSILNGTDFAMVPIFVDQGGTRLYIKDHFEGKIIQASIATANDISSTIAYVAKSPAYFTFTADSLAFSSNGSKLFYGVSGTIQERSLSTAWDITTVSNTSNSSLSVPASSSYGGFVFNAAGTTLYSSYKGPGGGNTDVYTAYWTLSTAFDLSTASSRTDIDVTSTITSGISLTATNLLDSAVGGDDIIMIGGTGYTYAFKGGVAVADYNSLGTTPSGVFRSSLNKNYIYQLSRTGTDPNYVWKLRQWDTNL